MTKYINQILVLFVAVFVLSCEKVIEIPLDSADQQVVIEAVGRNFEGESYVLLSRSGSVYDDSGFEKLSGATVTITDKDGIETVFAEEDGVAGRYSSPTFTAQPNNQYSLEVLLDGTTYSGTSTTPSVPKIDSLTYIPQFGGFGPNAGDTTLLVFYNFTDDGSQENYYRARIWVNGDKDFNYYLGTDVLSNGQVFSAPFFGTHVVSGDTVYVELLSMDEANYTYLFTLANNQDQSPFSAVPGNPVTNIENGIGYFGAFMVDTVTMIMP